MPSEHNSFTSHIPILVATATGTALASIVSGYFGLTGTIIALVAGSIVSGAAAWWIERWIRYTTALARAKADAIKRHGRPLSLSETQEIKRVVVERSRLQRHWRRYTAIAAGTLTLASAVVIWTYALTRHVAPPPGPPRDPPSAPARHIYRYPPASPTSSRRRPHPHPSLSVTTISPSPTVTVTVTPTPTPTPDTSPTSTVTPAHDDHVSQK